MYRIVTKVSAITSAHYVNSIPYLAQNSIIHCNHHFRVTRVINGIVIVITLNFQAILCFNDYHIMFLKFAKSQLQ